MADLDEYKSRFSEDGVKILEEAIEESQRRKQNYISDSHILQAFFTREPSLLNSILKYLSVPREYVEKMLQKHLEISRKHKGKGFRISPQVTELFIKSMDRANTQGRNSINQIDLLITLAQDKYSLLNDIVSEYDVSSEEIALSILASKRKNKSNKVNLEEQQNFISENDKTIEKKVFVVHGQDELSKTVVARFLENLKLDPIILHEQSSSSRTLIEMLEKYSDVSFAVILLTPDDIGALSSSILSTDKKIYEKLSFRARQNVILELGYFIGKLGRNKVCALYKGNIELPTDYSGIVYISMDDNGAWKQILARELKNIGLEVHLEGLLK